MTSPTRRMSPARLIDLFDRFRGALHDVTEHAPVSGDALRHARDTLVSRIRARVSPGDLVLLSLPNGPLFFSGLCGLLEAGAAPVLMHQDSPRAELLRMARRCAARFALLDVDATPDMPSRDLPGSKLRVPLDGVGVCDVTEIEDVEPRTRPDLAGVPLHPTSGTTGDPKLAVRDAECAVAEAVHYVDTLGLTARDTILCTTPMSHAYAYGMCFVVPLLSSASVVSMRRLAPRAALRTIRELDVTVLPAVPATLDSMMNAVAGPIAAPPIVLTAGTPLPAATARHFAERTGVHVRPLYGTTETGGISIASADAATGDSGVGAPMRGVDVRVRAAGVSLDGRDLGILQIRSASMMAGYLVDEGIDESMVRDGWFETGDLAHLREDGTIHLHGREKDFINVFGMKVVPAEVEAAIAGDDRVTDVKVYAGRHASGSEAVYAAIVPRNGFQDADAIRRLCQQQLVAFKCPTRIYFLDALPRTASGKVIRKELPGAV